MSLDISFKQVCLLIKKDQPDLADSVDKFLGLVLLCSPVFTGNAALLPLLTAKNELTKLSKAVIEAFAKRNADTYFDRQVRMRAAYGLISYTAFFEAIDYLLPAKLRSKMKLLDGEQAFILREALAKTEGTVKQGAGSVDKPSDESVLSLHVQFPHPIESLDSQKQRLEPLYRQMAVGFKEFIQRLAVWEQLTEKEKLVTSEALEKLPEIAKDFFEAQYLELCRKYEEFAIWANIQEHKRSAALIENLSAHFRNYAASFHNSSKSIDIGLNNLHKLVLGMPQVYKLSHSEEIVEGLRKHYVARINDPIIDDKSESDEGVTRLVFPRVCDAFVPQSFHAFRMGSKKVALEDPSTWKSLSRRDDLGTFILSYLSSPYSTESPLIILGHPGSGKSLLTTVLSAQLLSKHFTPIRVPLREVNSEASIVSQIEEHIGRVTSIRLDSWAKCSGAFENNPPVVILDGYDELLQASGKVFAGYLRDVQTFQRNEAEQGRPVRVIVTSRVTLIDKALVPHGSTILRLLEFNKTQRDRWISIWNSANASYFRNAKVQPFKLPSEKDADASKLLQLAEQPLLLLMLALYDSAENKLRSGRVPDRTILYDSLLRRFVVREREKSDNFKNLPELDRSTEIDKDMQRLGAAAIGMYNRRTLHILSDQLSDDLRFFNLERSIRTLGEGGRQLSQADLLLGSFFFVHKSRAMKESEVGEHQEATAFEFLHNTFGEFLTADFIIRQTIAEINELIELGSRAALRFQRERKLGHVDGLSRLWFACLVYTALFTRPVVLEMIREWIGHVLSAKGLDRTIFTEELDAIFRSQIGRVLGKREMPSIMQKDEAQEGFRVSFEPHPLIGHLAVYSINLVVIRVIMSEGPYEFDEKIFLTHEDGTRPWDQLAHLWHSWFSIDSINGVTAVFKATRNATSLIISPLSKISAAESRNRLETMYNVNKALGDNAISGIIGLALSDEPRRIDLDEIENSLKVENIDVSGQVALKKLMEFARSRERPNLRDFFELASSALDHAARSERIDDLANMILIVKRMIGRYPQQRLFREDRPFPHLSNVLMNIADSSIIAALVRYNVDAAIALVQLVGMMGERASRRVSEHLYHSIVGRGYLWEVSAREPEIVLGIIELIRELDMFRWASRDRDNEEFLERLFREIDFERWIERRPEDVAKLVQLLVSAGTLYWADRIRSEFFKHFRRRQFLEMAEHRPNRAVDLLHLAAQLKEKPWTDTFDNEIFSRIFARIHLEEWFADNPEGVIKLLNVARDFEGDWVRRNIDDNLFAQIFRRHHPVEWAEQHPAAAFTIIELALDLRAKPWAAYFAEGFFKQSFVRHFLTLALHRDAPTFAKAVRVARLFEGEVAGDLLREHLNSIFADSNNDRNAFYRLPIQMLGDLEWLKEQASTKSAGAMLKRLTSARTPGR
jgi:hypothetical protein